MQRAVARAVDVVDPRGERRGSRRVDVDVRRLPVPIEGGPARVAVVVRVGAGRLAPRAGRARHALLAPGRAVREVRRLRVGLPAPDAALQLVRARRWPRRRRRRRRREAELRVDQIAPNAVAPVARRGGEKAQRWIVLLSRADRAECIKRGVQPMHEHVVERAGRVRDERRCRRQEPVAASAEESFHRLGHCSSWVRGGGGRITHAVAVPSDFFRSTA